MKQLHKLVMESSHDLAAIITRENGKPFKEAKAEVASSASFIEFYAEECSRIQGTMQKEGDRCLMVMKEAIGPAALITPWNFPSSMLARKFAPALAAGCTVIAKPAHETPLSALAMAHLVEKAGFPKGSFNVITCDEGNVESVVDSLLQSDKVKKVSFTGSTSVGKKIAEKSMKTLKRLSMELGGNAPVIVFEDAKEIKGGLDSVVDAVIASKFRNSGQTCVCANRIFVHALLHDEFVEKLARAVRKLKVGNGFDENVNQGPLLSIESVEKVEMLMKDAMQKGAKMIVGGNRLSLIGKHFYEPTLLTNCDKSMQIFNEEIFGPIAAVYKFNQNISELANDCRHGLAAYIFTNNLSKSMQAIQDLEYGMIGVNEGIISTVHAPFGGVKDSGFGREGSHAGIEEYLQTKYICIK